MNFFKKLFKLILDILFALIIATVVVAVGVVVYVAESPEEFFELRGDNLVEFVLNKEDDISLFEMGQSVYCAYVTTVEASKNFGNDPMMEDAYKHYTWNYESTGLLGEEKTKLITDNHEMALSIRGRVKEYFDESLKIYKKNIWWFPYTRSAIKTAKAIPEIRKEFVYESRLVSPDNIQDYYTPATIMDFWNNEMGRSDYISCDGDLTRPEAFTKAISKGRLIETYATFDPAYNIYALDYVTNDIDY